MTSAADPNEVLECGLTRRQVEELMTRDLTPNDYALLLELDEKVAKKTMKKEDLAAAISKPADDVVKIGAECGVCLDSLHSCADIVSLPCKHQFHDGCITKWLSEYSTQCPFKCAAVDHEVTAAVAIATS